MRCLVLFRDKDGYGLGINMVETSGTFGSATSDSDALDFTILVPSGPLGTATREIYAGPLTENQSSYFCCPIEIPQHQIPRMIVDGNELSKEHYHVSLHALLCSRMFDFDQYSRDLIFGSGWQLPERNTNAA